jgi:predicted Zn-dependent peptidase
MSVYERHTLSNGLRVLTASLGHAQSVACYVMLAAGSRYANASYRGIAYFAEHMFFKGTQRRPLPRAIAMEVDSIGGEFNAFTGRSTRATTPLWRAARPGVRRASTCFATEARRGELERSAGGSSKR